MQNNKTLVISGSIEEPSKVCVCAIVLPVVYGGQSGLSYLAFLFANVRAFSVEFFQLCRLFCVYNQSFCVIVTINETISKN